MSENNSGQQPTQSTAQPANQNEGQQQTSRDQSVDQGLIYLVQKSYQPVERQIQESANNTHGAIPEQQIIRKQVPQQPEKQKTNDKQQS